MRGDSIGHLLATIHVNLGVEDGIPDFAGHAVTDVTEFVMMLHVVDLEVAEVLAQSLTVMKVIVDHVVDDVANPEAGHEGAEVRVGNEQAVKRMDDQKVENVARNGRKNKSQAVAREGMMDAVDHKVASKDPLVLGRVVHPVVLAVEKESVKHVFGESPEGNAGDDADNVGSGGGRILGGLIVGVGTPEHGDHPPVRLGAHLEERVLEEDDVSHGVRQNLGLVNILNIVLKSEIRVEDLPE